MNWRTIKNANRLKKCKASIKIVTSIVLNTGEVTTEEGSEDGLEAQSEDTDQLIKGGSPHSLQTIGQVRYKTLQFIQKLFFLETLN